MITFPNAKINLGLNIISKRADGFHNIESVFASINWYDALEFSPSDETIFTSAGIQIPSNGDSNLVLQAYTLLKEQFDLPHLAIHLEKNIPIGAGLGGGSADATFMLKALNDHFKLDISQETLKKHALKLGSDCPFFVSNKIASIHGRGEIIKPLTNVNLSNYSIVLINPNIHVSTQEAYRNIEVSAYNSSIESILNQPLSEWHNLGLKNDFETTIFPKYPEIKSVKDLLYKQGALYAAMSGSGSTVFGIFDSDPPAITTSQDYQIHTGRFL